MSVAAHVPPPNKNRATALAWLSLALLVAVSAREASASGNVAESVLGTANVDDLDIEWERNTGVGVGQERLHGCFVTPTLELYYFRVSSTSELQELTLLDTSDHPIRVNTACAIGVGRATNESWGRPIVAYWEAVETGPGDKVYFLRDTAADPTSPAAFVGSTGGAAVYWPQQESHPQLALTGLESGQIQLALPQKFVSGFTDTRGLVLRRCRPASNGQGGCVSIGADESFAPDRTVYSVAVAARAPIAGSWGGCASPAPGDECVSLAYEFTSAQNPTNSKLGYRSRLIGAVDSAWVDAAQARDRGEPPNLESPVSVDSDGKTVWVATTRHVDGSSWYPMAYRLESAGWSDAQIRTGVVGSTATIGAWPAVHLLDGVPTVTYWDEYSGGRILAKFNAAGAGCSSYLGPPCWTRIYKMVDAPSASDRYQKRHAVARHRGTDALAFVTGIARNGAGALDRPLMFTIREDQLANGIVRPAPSVETRSAPKIVGDGSRWVAVYRATRTAAPIASELRFVRWNPAVLDGSGWESTEYVLAGFGEDVQSFDVAWSGQGFVVAYRKQGGEVRVSRRSHAQPTTVEFDELISSTSSTASAVSVAATSTGDAVVAYRTSVSRGFGLFDLSVYTVSRSAAGVLGAPRLVETGTNFGSYPSTEAFDVGLVESGEMRVATTKVGTSRALFTRSCTFPCSGWSAATTLGLGANERWMDDSVEVAISPTGGGAAAIVTGVEYGSGFADGKLVAHETANGSVFGATPRVLDAQAGKVLGHDAGASYNSRGELRAGHVNLSDGEIRLVRDFPGNGASRLHVVKFAISGPDFSEAARVSTDTTGEGFVVVGYRDDVARSRVLCEPTVY